jgi:hypothetical protein
MAHKKDLGALYHTLQDLRGNSYLMGGCVVVLPRGFRQTLPIIPRSTSADELNACLKASHLWRYVKKFTLTTNMRVHLTGDASAGIFSEQLMMLGDGKELQDPNTGLIEFPRAFCNIIFSVDELKANVFPNSHHNYRRHGWLCESAILAPKKNCVHTLNLQIQNMLPTNCKSYQSVDVVMDLSQVVLFPVENSLERSETNGVSVEFKFLNSLESTGIPPHNQELKIGVPIMLLRNLDSLELGNGTRLCVKNLCSHLIQTTVLTGLQKARIYSFNEYR